MPTRIFYNYWYNGVLLEVCTTEKARALGETISGVPTYRSISVDLLHKFNLIEPDCTCRSRPIPTLIITELEESKEHRSRVEINAKSRDI